MARKPAQSPSEPVKEQEGTQEKTRKTRTPAQIAAVAERKRLAEERRQAKGRKHREDQAKETKAFNEEVSLNIGRQLGKRGSPYNREVWNALMLKVASGLSLRKACAEPDMPDLKSVWRWMSGVDIGNRGTPAELREMPEAVLMRQQYALAVRDRGHALVEDLLDISDTTPPTTQHGIDRGYVEWQKLRVDTRKWIASKMLPAIYGDKIEIEQKGNIIFALDVGRTKTQLSHDADGKPLITQAEPAHCLSGSLAEGDLSPADEPRSRPAGKLLRRALRESED